MLAQSIYIVYFLRSSGYVYQCLCVILSPSRPLAQQLDFSGMLPALVTEQSGRYSCHKVNEALISDSPM